MDYGKIVSQGWKITWENKYLWVLGFLAALGSSRSSSSSNYSQEFDPQTFSPEVWAALGAALMGIICFALVIGLILWVVSIVARGGLIAAVYKISTGKQMTLGRAFAAGTDRIWSLLGMNLLLALPMIILVVMMIGIFAVSFAGASTMESAVQGIFALLILLCCVIVIVAIVIQFINAFAYRGMMIYKMGAIESISHGWEVVKQNFGEVLVLALLFFVITIVYFFATMIVLLPVLLVAIVPLIGSMDNTGITVVSVMYLIGVGLCFGIVGAVLNSILTTWQSASFTLAYKEWTKKMGFVQAEDLVEKI